MPATHQALLDRLVRQLEIAQSDKYVQMLGESLRNEVAALVPVATGNMAQKLLRMGGPRRHGSAFEMWLGDQRQLGNPGRAPRGTIKAFLRDYPQYRFRRKGMHFNSSQAWWLLSQQAKNKLQAERMAGNYGGGYQGIGSNKAGYFYPQEGSDPDWAASADAAGIVSQHFVGKAVQIWTEQDVPRVMARFVSDMAAA